MSFTLRVQVLVAQEPHLDGLSMVLLSTLKVFNAYIFQDNAVRSPFVHFFN